MPVKLPMTPTHSSYDKPKSVEQVTQQNVETVVRLEQSAQQPKSLSDKVADFITRFCGTMLFLWIHVLWFAVWILCNTFLLPKAYDPFPFNFLTLVVSLEAIFLSTFILISENRQALVDERRSHLDLQINLLSEQENTKMLRLLKEIAEKLGINPDKDPAVAVLEQATRPDKLVEQIERTITESEAKK